MNRTDEVIQPSDTEKAEPQNKKLLLRIILIMIPIIFMAVICVFGVIAAIISGFMLSSAYDTRAEAAAELFDNRTVYSYELDGGITDISFYSFSDGYVSEEMHYFDGDNPENNSVSGDITDYNKMYRVEASRFSNKVAVYSSEDGKAWELIIKCRIIYSDVVDWYLEDIGYHKTDDIISTRNKILEDKNFSEGNSGAVTPPEKYETDIPIEILGREVYYHEYVVTHASGDISLSIEVGKVIDRCCKDYTNAYSPYYETRYEYIPSEIIEEIENSTFAEYLGNSFIVNIRGKILLNPNTAGYYTESQDIITLLVHFDENDNCIGVGNIYISDEFNICAKLMAIDQAF